MTDQHPKACTGTCSVCEAKLLAAGAAEERARIEAAMVQRLQDTYKAGAAEERRKVVADLRRMADAMVGASEPAIHYVTALRAAAGRFEAGEHEGGGK
jgi:hypothetical protein